MLDLFRQRGITNVVYGLVIAATIFAFVITFRPNAQSRTASLTESCAARVRGRCITPKDFGASYRILMPSRSQALSRRMNLKKLALDGLVERELLADEAKRLGIAVTEKEVTDMLYSGFIRVSVPAADPQVMQQVLGEMYRSYAQSGGVPQDVAQAQFAARDTAIPVDFRDPKTKRFDLKIYERMVRNLSNRSTTEFREEQARELLASKMRDVIRDPIRVSDAEAWADYERRYTSATLSYVPVKESWAARWLVDVSQGDVDAWVKEHQAEYDAALEARKKDDLPKAGHVRHILVKLPYGATDSEKAAAVAKLSWAAARIKAGEPFAEVARDISEDTGSAAMGGDVGEKTDQFVAPFKAAADALKAGETTAGAVETQFGYHLITKDDPAKAADVEAQVKRAVMRSVYAKYKSTEAAQVLAKKIAASMHDGKAADDAIKDAIAPYVHETKVEPLTVLHPAPEGDAGVTDAAATGDAAPAAPASATNKPSPAAKDKDKEAKSSPGFDASTDPDAPKLETSSSFNHGGDPFPGLSPEATTTVVSFAFSSKDGDVLGDPVRTQDSYNVVQLKQHKVATREEFAKDRDTVVKELLTAKRDEALSLYVKRLREQAKDDVKIDESYVQEAKVDGGAGGAPSEEDEEGY
jgi:parvulin-like peptidyl-prolyl isomerase